MANLTEMQLDAVGEVLNISMGSAATAVSKLLNAKVWITTPKVSISRAGDLDYDRLEPAICVKIVYVKGLSGSNLMILKQEDVQLILNQLMGRPPVISPDFEFDELNISAVSEVMNQMMGASATALSDFLDKHIDISTPTPYILTDIKISDLQDVDPDSDVVVINFDLTIDGVIKSEFISLMEVDLAESLANRLLAMNGFDVSDGGGAEEEDNTVEAPQPDVAAIMAGLQAEQAAAPAAAPTPAPAPAPAPTSPDMYNPQMGMMPGAAPGQMPQMPQMPSPEMYAGQQPYGYPPPYQMPYGYPPYGQQPPQPQAPPQPQINYQNAQLAQFESFDVPLTGDQKDNLQLLMDVPLQISVEIGSTTRKIKDILEFTQGTIIELERQAGAPVDIVVNGNLIARGDAVVIDDNFAVRITEIVKSKFMDSLGKENK